LVGFDFIPAPSGVWCVEANPGTGLIGSPDPQGFDPDPVVAGIFDLARDLGMRRVLWMGSDTIRVWPRTLEALARCAHDTGLDLDVRDDPRLPRRYDLPAGRAPRRRPAGAPDDVPDDTLVVGHNEYAIGPDHVLSDKELFIRSMAGAPEGVGESPVRVPPMTRLPPPLPSGSDPNLPNLVYKFPDSSQGRGVFFMRVRDAAQAIIIARALDREHGEPPGLFQPFVLSSLLPGRRIYDVRAHAFLSPVGCRYLGGQRRESVRTLPDRLEEGLVQQRVAFTSNISQGNLRADIPADEEPRIAAAASAAAETIAGILKRGFRTTPR